MKYVFSWRVLHVSWNAHKSMGSRKDATASTSSDGKAHNGERFRRRRKDFNFQRMLFPLRAILLFLIVTYLLPVLFFLDGNQAMQLDQWGVRRPSQPCLRYELHVISLGGDHQQVPDCMLPPSERVKLVKLSIIRISFPHVYTVTSECCLLWASADLADSGSARCDWLISQCIAA